MENNIQNIDLEKNKQDFIDIYKKYIHREGSDKFLDWLLTTDFFTAPASTKFHSAMEGGLCFHSLNTYNRFLNNLKNEYGEQINEVISEESIAVIALLHDICKVNCYKVDYRNVKVDGEWTKQPFYAYSDSLPYGHGEKSVYMISGFFKLTREEAMAINWHMGGFDTRVLGGSYSLSGAFYQFPVACIFHISDIQATYLDEQCVKM